MAKPKPKSEVEAEKADLTYAYRLVHTFLAQRSHKKVASALKKAANGIAIVDKTVDYKGPTLQQILKEWKELKAAADAESPPAPILILNHHPRSLRLMTTVKLRTLATVKKTKEYPSKSCTASPEVPRSLGVTRAKHCLLQMITIVTKSLRTSLARIRVKMKNLMPTQTRMLIPILTLETLRVNRRP
ncbi:hypothetical protein EDB83DRAFT_1287695 [Lactarius deliciosus]|nr:hypothetical protein EDB83DRAFT_1287695 [Lactarius deliciosus]